MYTKKGHNVHYDNSTVTEHEKNRCLDFLLNIEEHIKMKKIPYDIMGFLTEPVTTFAQHPATYKVNFNLAGYYEIWIVQLIPRVSNI